MLPPCPVLECQPPTPLRAPAPSSSPSYRCPRCRGRHSWQHHSFMIIHTSCIAVDWSPGRGVGVGNVLVGEEEQDNLADLILNRDYVK